MAESTAIRAEGESEAEAQCASVALTMDETGETGGGEDEAESPRVHSLLICPSQWSALLESTPIHLVRRKEGETQSLDERCYHEEVKEVLDQDVTEVKVHVYNEPPPHPHPSPASTRVDHLSSPSPLVSPAPLPEDFLCLHTSSPIKASLSASMEEEERTLVAPLSPTLKQDELRIDMEDVPEDGSQSSPSVSGRRGESVVTFSRLPYQTHSRHVSETLALMTTHARPAYQTHSRNVSETPSLPPFHSSSTSSAYHSRNSSLGSQISSCCFESDSMLSNFTDMDSYHSDLKPPIRLQDSKVLGGRGEPTCYSSDLSLHCHMTKPIRGGELLGSSPTLEDTLRGGGRVLVLESIDQRRNCVALKSSEWIKQEMESSHDSLVQVKVSSKSKHVVHYNVKAGDVIFWEFATKKRDIGFGVLFEATEVATEETPLPSSHESLEKKMTSVLPKFRVCTHAHPTVGSHTSQQDGVYEIVWDNTYSRFFSKELYYRITTLPAVPNDNYLQQ